MRDEAAVARTPAAYALHVFCRGCCRVGLRFLVRPRYLGMRDLRAVRGGMLIASNHQSFLDPMLIGSGLVQPISYLARSTLFEVPVFGRLIYALGAHPVRRGAGDASALRTVLKLLRGGQKLLMFPEGTRSRDGRLGEFKAGAASVAIRCRVPVMPACVEGAFECWPRTQALPRAGRVAVAYGTPMDSEGESPESLTRKVRTEVARMQGELSEYLAGLGQ